MTGRENRKKDVTAKVTSFYMGKYSGPEVSRGRIRKSSIT